MSSQKDRQKLTQDATQLLQNQVELYEQLLALEEKFSGAVFNADQKAIGRATRSRTSLLARLEENHGRLEPLLTLLRAEDGSFTDAAAEKLRQHAVQVMQKILEFQKKNFTGMQKQQQEMLEGIQATHVARQVARGYKPSPTLQRSRFDAKS